MEMILERIGSKQEEVSFNQKGFLSFGRQKDNDVVCPSLLVSRKHCIFFYQTTDLRVTDLTSSNGVFVNGVRIEDKTPVALKDNDIVGIGINEIKNLDPDNMFVYRVKKRIVISNNSDDGSGSPLVSSSIGNGQEIDRQTLKEQCKARKLDLEKLPCKILKTDEENVHVNCSDDDFIEIIECKSTKSDVPKSKQKEDKKYTNVSKHQQEIAEEIAEAISDIIELSDSEDVQCNSDAQINKLLNNVKPEPMETNENEIVPSTSNDSNRTSNANVNINQNHINIKQELQSSEVQQEPMVTVKEEPDWSHFSQVDIVEINDDDDNDISIFTYSQNFEQDNVKKECENNNDDELQSSLFLDDDDENVVIILDSDEDDNVAKDNQIDFSELIPPIKIEPNITETDIPDAAEPEENIDSFINGHVVDSNLRSEVTSDEKELPVPEVQSLISDINKNISVDTNEVSRVTEEQTSTLSDASKGLEAEISESASINEEQQTSKEHATINEEYQISKEHASINEEQQTSKEHASINEEQTSKEKSSTKLSSKDQKIRTKGVEIVEPHHLKPRRRRLEKDYKKKHESRKGKSSKSEKYKKKTEDLSNENSKSKTSSSKSAKSNSYNDESINNELNDDDASKEFADTTYNENLSNNISNSETHIERPKCRTTKVKVKVSQKSRGDMLCETMLTSKPQSNKKKKQDEVSKKPPPPRLDVSSFVIPRRQVPSSMNFNNVNTGVTSGTSSMTSGFNRSSLSSSNRETTTVVPNVVNHVEYSPSRNESPPHPNVESMSSNVHHRDPYLKPSLKIPSLLKSKCKTVSFNDTPAVQEFQIQNGNKLRNIKDGLSLRSTKKDLVVYKQMELKIEDFLARVFAWEPIWLQQQGQVKHLPPIVKPDDMQQLPIVFNSFQQYYKRMEVLLLLETWQQLLKEFQCTGIRYSSATVLPCQLVRYSMQQMTTPNGLRFSTLAIYAAVSKVQLQRQNHPVYGDMVILEYVIKEGNARRLRRAFAYVKEVQQQNAQKFMNSHQNLCKSVSRPDVILTYTVQTRVIDEHTMEFDQLGKIRSILYMRSHLRLIQAIQYVPHSPLRDSILDVNIDGFQMSDVKSDSLNNCKLITKEKLNGKQLEAILKFTNASIKFEPKIGLLVGPPGTGKSKVIANLVMEILYGNERYINGKHKRILVCAPSNAAIDEIVLRLLDIRGAIKDHRFKMVRIGRLESMHEEVKKISLVELGRSYAQKFLNDQKQKIMENVEAKKHQLKKDINALELLVANNPYNKNYKRDLDNQRNKLMKLTQKSPEQEPSEMAKLQADAKNTVLAGADVITCTLTSCYTGQMENIFGGENKDKIATCIVDEATQCCEAETLIPLMLGVKTLILVGDPNQLPATVMSSDAKKLGLDRSLFTRTKEALEPQCNEDKKDCKNPVITLNIQYRMVNAISYWPNKYFYGGKLVDSVNYKPSFPFQPYRVLNLDGNQDDTKFSNLSEATFVGNLIHCLITCSNIKMGSSRKITVGVITPYQNQKSLILSTIRDQIKNVPESVKSNFITEVNTIDSFQGQERDVIIMSCVRSNGIGFLSDHQRLCVALTRAKFSLILCGNFTTFERDSMWKDLIRDARSRGVVANLQTTARPSDIKPHVIKLK